MELLNSLVDLALHLDKHLLDIVTAYGTWAYAILFAIVFCETGLIVTPFLPGDSLLFAAGTVAALGALSPIPLIAVLIAAAILGDAVNYSVGRTLGARAGTARFVNQQHLQRSAEFYSRHGGKTIVIARFIPIVRTFAPFAAGVANMSYHRFAAYNVFGAVVWVISFVGGGFVFGTIPLVRDNLTLVMIGIIVFSILPSAVDIIRRTVRARLAARALS